MEGGFAMSGLIINKSSMPKLIPKFIQDYFYKMEVNLHCVEFDIGSDENIYSDIKQIFVPMPTNIKIGIEVKDRKVISVIENGVSYKADSKFSSFFESLCKNLLEHSNRTPLIYKPNWKNGTIKNYLTLNAIDAISEYKNCIVLGGPGSGKSMLLQFLTLSLIEQYKTDQNVLADMTRSTALYDELVVPIYIQLRNMFKNQNEKVDVDSHSFLEYLFGENYDEHELYDYFKKTNFIFFFDGIDEIFPHKKVKNYVNRLIAVVKALSPNARIVFSSRKEKGNQWMPSGFNEFQIEAMDQDCQMMLVHNTLKARGVSDIAQKTTQFFDEIDKSSLEKTILGTPLFLSLMIFVYLNRGYLPTQKSLILKEGVRLLIRRWRVKILEIETVDTKNSFFFDINNLMNVLEHIAYTTVFGDRIIKSNSLIFPQYVLDGKLIDILKKDSPTYNDNEVALLAVQIRNCLVEKIGIIRERNSSDYESEMEFSHRHFQEYLAAKKLSDTNNVNSIIKAIVTADPVEYYEVLSMFIEVLNDKKDFISLWQLILLILNELKKGCKNRSWWTWFLCQIVSSRDYLLLSSVNDYLYMNCENSFKELSEMVSYAMVDTNLLLKKRVYCARFLSEFPGKLKEANLGDSFTNDLNSFGDVRQGVGILSNGCPDISWCKIDGTHFTFGLNQNEIKELIQIYPNRSFERELPSCILSVDSFEISRYPITFLQYKSFCDDGAYTKREFWNWSQISLEWFDSIGKYKSFADLFDNCYNAPVVNISWIEAKGFCEWLSHKTGNKIRLPYEFEWELASKQLCHNFSATRLFDENIYVSNSTQLKKAAPVGLYAYNSIIPSDMNGNVWEWTQSIMDANDETLNDYSNKIIVFESCRDYNLLSYNTKMVVKGGCFLNSSFQSRNTYRGRDYIVNHITLRQGFRIVKEVDK